MGESGLSEKKKNMKFNKRAVPSSPTQANRFLGQGGVDKLQHLSKLNHLRVTHHLPLNTLAGEQKKPAKSAHLQQVTHWSTIYIKNI